MTTRRDFIRISVMGAGALAVTTGAYGAIKLLSSPEEVKNSRLILIEHQHIVRFASGNVPDGFTKHLRAKSGKS